MNPAASAFATPTHERARCATKRNGTAPRPVASAVTSAAAKTARTPGSSIAQSGLLGLGEDDEHAEMLVADEAVLGAGGHEDRLAFLELHASRLRSRACRVPRARRRPRRPRAAAGGRARARRGRRRRARGPARCGRPRSRPRRRRAGGGRARSRCCWAIGFSSRNVEGGRSRPRLEARAGRLGRRRPSRGSSCRFLTAAPTRGGQAPPSARTMKPMPLSSSATPTTMPKSAICSAM